MGEVRQVEVGLHNLQERLTAVQATLDATQRSLALFLDTQEALNLGLRPFRAVFDLGAGTPARSSFPPSD